MRNERDQIALYQQGQQDKRDDETRDGSTAAPLPGNEIPDSGAGQDERDEGAQKYEVGPHPGTKYPVGVSRGTRDGDRSFHATNVSDIVSVPREPFEQVLVSSAPSEVRKTNA
jgi:hypothetical protein